ncbi:MAG: 50S ribosomal protein L25 [Candidatus Omnitrophota bacterium]
MEFVDLNVSSREEKGKEQNKKIRSEGLVPAVVYKKGEETLNLKIDKKSLATALHTDAGENVILKLHIKGAKKEKEKTVIIKEIQKDPIKDIFLHVDFQEISLTDTIEVKTRLTAKGEAIGVKQDGGVLQQVLWEVDIECLPTNIPEKIVVDITNLKIGDFIHVSDLKAPEGVKILNDAEEVAFSVEHVKTVEDVVAAEPQEGETQEPELIREKKEKEEAEEEASKEENKKEGE